MKIERKDVETAGGSVVSCFGVFSPEVEGDVLYLEAAIDSGLIDAKGVNETANGLLVAHWYQQ